MDYDRSRDRGNTSNPNPNYATSPSSTSFSPRAAYQQERESRSSKSMRSQQGADTSESQSQSQSRHHRSSNPNRSSSRAAHSPHSSSSKPRSASSGYSSPNTNGVPQDGYGHGNGHGHGGHGVQTQHYDQHQPQAPHNHYDNGQGQNGAAAVTPNPQPEIQSNTTPHVSSSYSQGSSQTRRPAYLLHRDLVIGKGSYGQVCIASRGEAEGSTSASGSGKRKKFACKCVVLRNDAKYIAKLQEEVNVLRELRGHENVIRLYDVFCVDNELFIITELGRGGDLFHLLTTHPKHGVTEAYAAKTVSQMLSAVGFLHSRNIVHRDLKLENWVLESGKDVWSPLKLIDFGLSTHFTAGHRLSRVVGSSYYVAPEVLKKSYTEACDLWSLGVIVYMLLSGAPPFYGKNDEAIKASIVQGEYTFPHELFRDVSDEAMAFVSTLLSYNIEYRYTAEQALTHPWLAINCDPALLQRAKNGARGDGVEERIMEPMQM
jgi:calcium/calmodulin-dependent protein kinase I